MAGYEESQQLIFGWYEDGKVLYSMTKNPYGFEGICLAENIDKLAGLNVTKEIPTLYQISVVVMKNNTKIVMR